MDDEPPVWQQNLLENLKIQKVKRLNDENIRYQKKLEDEMASINVKAEVARLY